MSADMRGVGAKSTSLNTQKCSSVGFSRHAKFADGALRCCGVADAHGLMTDEYRKRWNLRSDYPMVAPAYSERRSGLAKQLGLGRGRRKSTASDTASEPESATTS